MMREIPLLTAQMGRTGDGSHWAVYVVLPSESRWPEVLLPATGAIPSISDRATALKRLGYVPFRTYPYWDWVETENPRDTESPVRLIATLAVVPAKSERPTEDSSRRS
ncbi:DUF6303 family protein [Streptomyces scopuliridis]|uniref:DUF6303 family protein n=1 Tax=Streptomyces scopuliridis TaxID=452529 RepID=A0ACD4ZLT7_9ACTN|nr:DUF6303 family protein [Streptomyces scopuliridis]WSB99135.1 DUF6303 family protein [Streptomyces scopuliridis]WSC07163.1 DUF6303 family protein [Streptomyces scopuliridis]